MSLIPSLRISTTAGSLWHLQYATTKALAASVRGLPTSINREWKPCQSYCLVFVHLEFQRHPIQQRAVAALPSVGIFCGQVLSHAIRLPLADGSGCPEASKLKRKARMLPWERILFTMVTEAIATRLLLCPTIATSLLRFGLPVGNRGRR